MINRFLWSIVMSAIYQNNLVYQVKGSFIFRSGRSATYWLAIICSFFACILFNLAITALRVTFLPKDADVFAELEQDPIIKSRFEEEAASELQQSWNRGKPSKEDEILALLDAPRCMEEGKAKVKPWVRGYKIRTSDDEDETRGSEPNPSVSPVSPASDRHADYSARNGFDDELAKRFGAVIRKPFKRLPTPEPPNR
jgi:hypothetical protein